MTKPKQKLTTSSLAKLSQAQLVELAGKIGELAEAQKFKREDFYLERMHDGQKIFHSDPHRIRIVSSGNRSGKSTSGFQELRWRCQGTHPFAKCKTPIRSAVVGPDFENWAKQVFERKFDEWVSPGEISKIERHQGGAIKCVYWKNGSTTHIFSHDQDLMVFEGTDWDLIWCDEPPPLKIWNALWRGCVDRGGSMYLTGTPLDCEWLMNEYNRLKDLPNGDELSILLRFEMNANAANLGDGDRELGLKRLKEFGDLLSEEEKDARLRGIPLQLSGSVFKNWSRHTHLIEPFLIPHNWPLWESIDPHPHKPWAVSYVAIAPDHSKILLNGYYFEGTIDDIAHSIVMARSQLPIKDDMRPRIARTLIDNSSSVPLWQKSNMDPTARRISVREELEMMIGPMGAGGPRVECAPKNVSQKIDILKRWLAVRERAGKTRPDFFVFNTQDNLEGFVREIEGYVWDRYKSRNATDLKTRPVKKNDDIIDSVMQVSLVLGISRDLGETVTDLTGGFSGYGSRRSVA